ncbi:MULTISPECIES: ComEC/Rec2 family competence protein [Rummeliibacillus]|uniref:ComEC/Rec2 family competence protein n=1 Tax=Rummeliibacillus TaxID=648802 RepID=UPI0011B36E4E|nr:MULTISPECIES: ComEC/Rec2 family competence protein [Rummeliibacillus]MBO2537761.1 MBL fold metallo-hydrolase [Rummeliibacillus suwonensis]
MKIKLRILFTLFSILLLTGCTITLNEADSSDTSETKPVTSANDQVFVHIIDIGQGDSIFIQTPKENIVIDGGNKGKGETVIDYLKEHGVKQLDAVISTHPDADHIGGLADIINAFPVQSVYAPRITHTTVAYRNFLQSVKAQGLKIKVAKKDVQIPVSEQSLDLHFIGPTKNYSKNDLNDWSAVLLMQHGDKKFLFTGDAETQAEEDMLEAGIVPKVDVLKVSHHGAREASNSDFLAVAKPTYAAISVGKDNRYGHPTAEALHRLKTIHAKIYRTDQHGTIVFTSNGTKISVKVER